MTEHQAAREALEIAVKNFGNLAGNEIIIAFVDDEGKSAALYTHKVTKIFTTLGNPSYRGFVDRMFTLVSVVFAGNKMGVINWGSAHKIKAMKTFPTIFKGQPGPDIEARDLKEAIFLRNTFLPDHELLILIEEGELNELEDTEL